MQKLNLKKSIVDALYISPIAKMAIEKFNPHIGESSGGWKFLFQRQKLEKQTENSLDSYKKWKNFLKRDEVEVYDGYNNLIDKDSFFRFIEDKQEEIHPTQEDLDMYPPSCRTMRYEDEEGYRFDIRDFS